ncbi:hypothetical protein FRC08_014528 [Ceratobasidium sp. 394]|nr:hypothetical protein FRC08_014528 [Ceratobasidium sp. 394]
MSDQPHRSKFFSPHERDDLDATGLPGTRRIPDEDPLSPSFSVSHVDPAIAPSPPTGFCALHPAAVEAARELKAAHDARVAIGQPGYIPGAEPTEPPRTAPIVNRTQSRDSASTGDSRLGGPFLSVLRRAFSRE